MPALRRERRVPDDRHSAGTGSRCGHGRSIRCRTDLGLAASGWSESFATDVLSDRCNHQRPFFSGHLATAALRPHRAPNGTKVRHSLPRIGVVATTAPLPELRFVLTGYHSMGAPGSPLPSTLQPVAGAGLGYRRKLTQVAATYNLG